MPSRDEAVILFRKADEDVRLAALLEAQQGDGITPVRPRTTATLTLGRIDPLTQGTR